MMIYENTQNTISVINRKTGTRYDITQAYYKKHRAKYIIAPSRQTRVQQDPISKTQIQPLSVDHQEDRKKKELSVKVKQKRHPTVHIENDALDLTDQQQQYIAQYNQTYDFELYFLTQPKYPLPAQLQDMQAELQYLASIKDNELESSQLIDVYFNQGKTKDVDAPFLVCVSAKFFRMRAVGQNQESEYFKMAKHAYNIFYNKQEIKIDMTENRARKITQGILTGGAGDKTNPDSLNQAQLQVGILVQMQHTNKKQIAKQIAVDHLTQHPNYYTKLIRAGLVDQKPALALAKTNGVIMSRSDEAQPRTTQNDKEAEKTPKENIQKSTQTEENTKDKKTQKIKEALLRRRLLKNLRG